MFNLETQTLKPTFNWIQSPFYLLANALQLHLAL